MLTFLRWLYLYHRGWHQSYFRYFQQKLLTLLTIKNIHIWDFSVKRATPLSTFPFELNKSGRAPLKA